MTAALEELVSQVQDLAATLPDIIKIVPSLSQDEFLLEKISLCHQSLEGIMDVLRRTQVDQDLSMDSEMEPDSTHVASDGSLTESDESIVLDTPPLFRDGTEEQDSLKEVYRHGNHLCTSTGQFVRVIRFEKACANI